MKKFLLCVASIIFFVNAGIFSQVQSSVLKDEILSELNEKGSIRHIIQSKEDVELSLTPDTPFAKKTAECWNSSAKPNMVSENLFLVSKEELKKKSLNPENVEFSMETVSKIVRSISKMKGMQYFSNGDQKWETLYHQAYVCNSVKEKNEPMPDVLEGSADGLKIFAFLEDNSFGKSVYSVEYFQSEKEVSFILTNAESWTYAFVKALNPENVKISMDVIDNGDSYIVYMVLFAKHKTIPLLGDRIQKSLANRIDAIFNWFTLQF